jgi:phosphoribosyl 1,2-cyclic phosphodiesterase
VKAKVWGCRGSLAAPGPDTIRYGGNTSCLEISLDNGAVLVLDAGTGARPLGLKLAEQQPKRIDVLLTHLHLDHLEGLGFFTPLWTTSSELHIWGPASPLKSLEDRIATYLSPPLFPVHLSSIPSHPTFHDTPEDEEWELAGVRLSAQRISHPGPTVGYRIEEEDRSLVYMPDHEPALGIGDLRSVSPEWLSGYSAAFGADVLFHDSQYTEEEYNHKVGWGHSSTEHVVTFAQLTKVRRLFMTHHDPLHDDDELDAILVRAKELWNGNGGGHDGSEITLAYEGMEVEV